MTHSLRSIEAEQAVIGGLLLSNDALNLTQQLRGKDFSEPLYGDMFKVIRHLVGIGEDVHAVVLATAMETDPRLAEWGGIRHLADLMTLGAPQTSIRSYARTLMNLSARRAIQEQALQLADQVSRDLTISPEEIVTNAARIFSEAVEGCSEPKPSRARAAFSADQLHDRPIPARQWHVKGSIPSSTVTILSGDGGTGKSTLALQLNVATVIGEPWLGQETRRGRTLYLSAEDDEDELHRRLDAIALHYDVKLADLEDLKIWPLTDAAGALLAEETARDRLQMTALWDELCDLAREWRPVLIVLDSLADVFGGNEISRPQVRQFIGELRCLAAEVGAAVVILAHPSVEGMRSGSGISGSTAWHNSARSRLYLGKPKSDEGGSDPAVRTLSQKKANYAAATGDLRLKLVLGAFNNLDTVGGATVSKAAREAYAEDVFMRLLDRFTRDGRRVGEATSRNYAPAVFASQDEAGEVTKKDLADAMNRLFSRGVIIMIDVGPPSKGTRALVRSNPE